MLVKPFSLSLPLLGKELVEQAARKRTYAVRVLYAALLFGVFALEVKNLTEGRSAEEVLGSGEQLFDSLMGWQVLGILAFLPAMTAGALAEERERGTLDLLRLTGLTPREILLQKYLGRLVPILTFQFLAIPLAALAYALGGVSDEKLIRGTAALIFLCAQVGALSLWAAAKSPTTMRALIRAYLSCALLYGILWILTPVLWLRAEVPGGWVLIVAVLTVGSTLLFLRWARLAYLAALYRPPPRPAANVKEWWRRTRGWLWEAIGEPFFGSELFAKRRHRPVTLGEFLGTGVSCLAAVLKLAVLMAFPGMVILVGGSIFLEGAVRNGHSGLMIFVWSLAAAVVAAVAAGTVATERSRQTLDVLLTTPMAGREIAERMTGSARRLSLWAAVPLFGLQAVLPVVFARRTGDPADILGRWAGTAAATALYLPTVVWIAFAVGCRVKQRMRAVLFAFGAVALWAAGTAGLAYFIARFEGDEAIRHMAGLLPSGTSAVVALISPLAGIVLMNMDIGPGGWTIGPFSRVEFLIVHFVVVGAIFVIMREWCLRRAEHWLGRA